MEDAPSNSQRLKLNRPLQADCAAAVKTRFMPERESLVTAALGTPPDADHWLSPELDPASQSPVVLFP